MPVVCFTLDKAARVALNAMVLPLVRQVDRPTRRKSAMNRNVVMQSFRSGPTPRGDEHRGRFRRHPARGR